MPGFLRVDSSAWSVAAAAFTTSDLTCEDVFDPRARTAWHSLRNLVGRLVFGDGLPFHAFTGSIFGTWVASRLAPGFAWVEVDWLSPLPEGSDCLLGRVVCWLLQRELRVLQAEEDLSRMPISVALRFMLGEGRLASEVLEEELGASPHERPLEALLLPEGGLPWAAIAATPWPVFAMLARCRRTFMAFLERHGQHANALSAFSLPALAFEQLTSPSVSHLDDVQKDLAAVVGNSTEIGPTLSTKRSLSLRCEWALRNFTAQIIAAGLGVLGAVLLVWLVDERLGLFEALYHLWLPTAMMLRLPTALLNMRGIHFDPALAAEERWLSPSCGRFRHGQALHGALPRMRLVPSPQRCAVVSRLMRSHHIVSANVRYRRQLHCNSVLLRVLWLYGLSGRPVRFVDVGASLGDCVLAAATLVPEGALQALALDADLRAVSMVREALTLNGLDVQAPNASRVVVRHVMLDERAGPPRALDIDEHVGVVADAATGPLTRASTLDRELRGKWRGAVDVLSIFGNGKFESSVLRGATEVLQEARVRCLLVSCPAEHCERIEAEVLSLVEGVYLLENRGSWLAASPEALGRSICTPRTAEDAELMGTT